MTKWPGQDSEPSLPMVRVEQEALRIYARELQNRINRGKLLASHAEDRLVRLEQLFRITHDKEPPERSPFSDVRLVFEVSAANDG